MRKGILIGLGLTAVGIGIYSMRYYKGIYKLNYSIIGLGIQGQQWHIELGIYNPTNFTYPVPGVFFNVYDKAGNYLGVVYSNVMQYVHPGANKIDAYLVANLAATITALVSALLPSEPLELLLDGYLQIAGEAIKLQIPITQKLSA